MEQSMSFISSSSTLSNINGDSDGDMLKVHIKSLSESDLPKEGTLSLPFHFLTNDTHISIWEINSLIFFLCNSNAGMDSFWYLLSINKDSNGFNYCFAQYGIYGDFINKEERDFLALNSTLSKVRTLYLNNCIKQDFI